MICKALLLYERENYEVCRFLHTSKFAGVPSVFALFNNAVVEKKNCF